MKIEKAIPCRIISFIHIKHPKDTSEKINFPKNY